MKENQAVAQQNLNQKKSMKNNNHKINKFNNDKRNQNKAKSLIENKPNSHRTNLKIKVRTSNSLHWIILRSVVWLKDQLQLKLNKNIKTKTNITMMKMIAMNQLK